MIMHTAKSQDMQGELATKRLKRTNDGVSVQRLAALGSMKIHVALVQVQRLKKSRCPTLKTIRQKESSVT